MTGRQAVITAPFPVSLIALSFAVHFAFSHGCWLHRRAGLDQAPSARASPAKEEGRLSGYKRCYW